LAPSFGFALGVELERYQSLDGSALARLRRESLQSPLGVRDPRTQLGIRAAPQLEEPPVVSHRGRVLAQALQYLRLPGLGRGEVDESIDELLGKRRIPWQRFVQPPPRKSSSARAQRSYA
jgi:hypothetical protein